MQKLITLLIALLPICVSAQTVDSQQSAINADSTIVQQQLNIAVYSYDKCLAAMEEVLQLKAEIEQLRSQYAEELRRTEADFNAKYEAFLSQQAKLAPSIRDKRQAELQKIVEENLAFKAKSQETLANTEKVRMQPIREKLHQIIANVAKEYNFAIVINTDGDNCPFFDPAIVIDITDTIIASYSN